MIKKIFIIFILIIAIFYQENSIFAYNLDSYLSKTDLVNPWDASIDWGFKDKILSWIAKIAWFLGLMAVWAIVWGSFMLALSAWEEEKIKKAKDMIKWAILWFLWIVLAASLISILITFIYSLW